ncbi:hypothetical protein TUM17576_46900 [Enterobacter hormaechei]|nr:hypothetical protein TUM17576_46900 [Enterobacter hormaechei]
MVALNALTAYGITLAIVTMNTGASGVESGKAKLYSLALSNDFHVDLFVIYLW